MLLGIGITLDYIVISLHQGAARSGESAPQVLDLLSLLLVLLGLGLLALAVWQYRLSIQFVRRSANIMPSRLMAPIAAAAVITFGVTSAAVILFRSL